MRGVKIVEKPEYGPCERAVALRVAIRLCKWRTCLEVVTKPEHNTIMFEKQFEFIFSLLRGQRLHRPADPVFIHG